MNDLLLVGAIPFLVLLFMVVNRVFKPEWRSLTKEEIWEIWDDNAGKFGTVEDFARKLERKLEDRNT